MQCNIIGAGRVGKNIALSLATNHLISLQSICNRSYASAARSCEELGLGSPVAEINQLPKADITWITCNDDSIASVVQELLASSLLRSGDLVIHCSGVLSSANLIPLQSLGCNIASVHPLKAFKIGDIHPNAFDQVDCTIEGDELACQWLELSFTQLGAHITTINPAAKAIYHAAATIASNYLITLAASSEELLVQTGMSHQQARAMITKLMQGNIHNLQQTNTTAEALTGPLMRGDNDTLRLHLQAIENPLIKALYKSAGLATLALTNLEPSKQETICQLLG